MVKKYLYNILISLDQLLNAVLGGDPDETISSHLGRREVTSTLHFWQKPIVWMLNKIDKNHCIEAIEKDKGGLKK